MTTAKQAPKSERVLMLCEPTELELDGRNVRALAIEMPNGSRKLFTEQSDGRSLLSFIFEAAHDPSMPKATMKPETSFTDLAREALQLLKE